MAVPDISSASPSLTHYGTELLQRENQVILGGREGGGVGGVEPSQMMTSCFFLFCFFPVYTPRGSGVDSTSSQVPL